MYTKLDSIDMKALDIAYRALCVACFVIVWLLAGCTFVQVETETAKVTIADLRVSGSAIDLEGVLNDVGSISVNREQGSALQDAAPIVEQLNPAPQFDFRPSL